MVLVLIYISFQDLSAQLFILLSPLTDAVLDDFKMLRPSELGRKSTTSSLNILRKLIINLISRRILPDIINPTTSQNNPTMLSPGEYISRI